MGGFVDDVNAYLKDEYQYLFDYNSGIWLNIYDLGIGISYKHITTPSFSFLTENIASMDPGLELNNNINFSLTYDYKLGDNKISNFFSINELNSDYLDPYFMLSNQFQYKNRFYAGLTSFYQTGDNKDLILLPNIGINLNDKFIFDLSWGSSILYHRISGRTNNIKYNVFETSFNYRF